MVRRLAISATAAALTLTAVNAHALFIFGPKKFTVTCQLTNEHPGAGAIGKQLPVQQLSSAGAASLSGSIDLISKNTVLVRGVRASIGVTLGNGGRYNAIVSFTKPTGQLIYKGSTILQLGAWSSVNWQDWPKSMGYLGAQCLVQKAK